MILPAFLVWGTASSVRGWKEKKYYGKIFGKIVSQTEFEQALKATVIRAHMQFGEAFNELNKFLNLEALTWQRLVLLYEAKKRRIRVSDAELVEAIAKDPSFQRNGKFDAKLYETIIRYSLRIPPRVFEEQTRQNLILEKLSDAITKDVALTDAEMREAYTKENEQISIYYIAGLPSDFQKELNPSDEELKDYFSQKSIDFKQPLSFNLEYLSVDSQDKWQDIESRLGKKEKLEKIVNDYNLALKETGLFGQTDPIPGFGWQEKISSLLPKSKVEDVLPFVEMDSRYYLFRLKERKEPYVPEFENIKDKVKAVFVKNKARDIAKEKIENCLKELKDKYAINPKDIDFDKIAKAFSLKSSSTDLFKSGSYIEGIGGSDKIFAAAKSLKDEVFSEIIDMPSGFYIVKLKTKAPIDEKKFAQEKDNFSKKLLGEKKGEFFAKFLEELIKKTQAP
jgi:peptidyl-prolyl cis-trans isomerase D